jgi:pSer/pThr/pTyr-binding forkhead associated (FHA) protein
MDVNLVLLKKNGSRKIFPLPSEITTIGRHRSCDLHIPLASVSKKHCQLHLDSGVLKLRDMGSKNGTNLNGKPVEEAVIQPGDFIEVGPLKFQVQIDNQPKDAAAPAKPQQKPANQNNPSHKPQQKTAPNSEANEADSMLDNFFAEKIDDN